MKTLLMICCFFVTAADAQDLRRFIVVDVGEGQSLILQHNQTAVIFDVGHAGNAKGLINKIQAYGIQSVSKIVLTHLHPDHASGFFRLNEAFPDAKVFYNCHPLADNGLPDMVRWLNDELKQQQAQCLKAGDKIEFADFKINVIWPMSYSGQNLNQYSLVMQLVYKNTQLLLMSDTDTTVEQELLNLMLLPDKTNLLVAGHHGAKDANSEKFIKAIKPEHSVVSVNANNIRGYPDAEVLNRLKKYSGSVWQTSLQGDVVFEWREGKGFIKKETQMNANERK